MPSYDEQIETREALERTVDIHEKHNNPTIRPQRNIDKPKHSPTIMLAGNGRQYKSIVKLMNDDPHLSKDRLTRVRYKEMQPKGGNK